MKVSPYQGDFSAGEIGPNSYGRTDSPRYKAALATCLNAIPTLSGPVMRRSGTRLITPLKTPNAAIIAFAFSRDQSFWIEIGYFGGLTYTRFHTSAGVVVSSGTTPYEIACPFAVNDASKIIPLVNAISVRQKNDVLFMLAEGYPPQKLQRFGATDWRWAPVAFVDGPYDDVYSWSSKLRITNFYPALDNYTHRIDTGPQVSIIQSPPSVTVPAGKTYFSFNYSTTTPGEKFTFFNTGQASLDGKTFTLSPLPGDPNTVTVDAVTTGFINNPAYLQRTVFKASDVGRLIRLQKGVSWEWGVITQVSSSDAGTSAYVKLPVQRSTGLPYQYDQFRLGTISQQLPVGSTDQVTGNGYPSIAAFHEDRLFIGGIKGLPGRVASSRTGDYENFSPTDLDGVVPADAALSFDIPDTTDMQWMESDEKGLLIGTAEAEFYARGSTYYEALSATNITVRKSTNYGSGSVGSAMASKSTLFSRGSEKRISDIQFQFDVDGFRVTDLSILADHITRAGIVTLDFQKEPTPILWAVLKNGKLAALTYDRDLDGLRAGWHRHELGGNGFVTSIAIIPSTRGGQSDVGMTVTRVINGATVGFLELIQPDFTDDTAVEDAWFVDCGLQYQKRLFIDYVARGVDPTVQAIAHGLTPGQKIKVDFLQHYPQANGKTYTVGVYIDGGTPSPNIFVILGLDTTLMPATGYTFPGAPTDSTYGYLYALASEISGLTYLEGQTVSILADGHAYENQTVVSGKITIDTPRQKVIVGLPFNTDIQTLRIEAGSQDGTSIGKKRRVNSCAFMVKNTSTVKIGMTFSDLDEVIFRQVVDDVSAPMPLYSGLWEQHLASPHDTENQICIRQDKPLPLVLQAIAPQMTTYDKG